MLQFHRDVWRRTASTCSGRSLGGLCATRRDSSDPPLGPFHPRFPKIQFRSFSFKVAIVGSGPSGCYTAKYLQSTLEKQGVRDVSIRVLERLPTPFGLVRFGVAPDHPEVKNVENDFVRLFRDGQGIKYYGNVHVGKDLSVEELRTMHDAVVLSYGCESDRKLGIKGESDLEGVLSARQFVAWYNGASMDPAVLSISTRAPSQICRML